MAHFHHELTNITNIQDDEKMEQKQKVNQKQKQKVSQWLLHLENKEKNTKWFTIMNILK